MAKGGKGGPKLVARLDELVGELHENLVKALAEFDSEAIHDSRVATRRLNAALHLAQPVLSDEHRKPFAKVLRKLRRRLGPLRDSDVMIEHLDELATHRRHGPAAVWLRDRQIRERDRQREKSRKRTDAADELARLAAWPAVRREIVEAGDAIDTLLAESLHLQLDAFVEWVRALAPEVGDGAAAAGAPAAQDPHEVRIAGKHLRYTLELATAQGHKLPAAVLRAFKKMQEALGDWHDWVVLVERAMGTSLEESLAYHNPKMQQQLLDLSRMLLARSSRELETFCRRWRERGQDVARTIRERFPLTRPVSEAQMGLGPRGPNGRLDPFPPPSQSAAEATPPPDAVSTA